MGFPAGARQRRRSRLVWPAGQLRGFVRRLVAGGAGWRAAVTGWDQSDLVAEPGEGLLVVADEILVVALVPLVVVAEPASA